MLDVARYYVERVKRLVIGNPQRLPRRLVGGGIVVLVATVVFGLWYLLTADVSAQTSSLVFLRPLLLVATSTWTPVVILLGIVAFLRYKLRDWYARQAESATGYDARTVKRLAAEATATDGARVIATDRDSRDDLADRIERALLDEEDERVRINPDAYTAPEDHDAAGSPLDDQPAPETTASAPTRAAGRLATLKRTLSYVVPAALAAAVVVQVGEFVRDGLTLRELAIEGTQLRPVLMGLGAVAFVVATVALALFRDDGTHDPPADPREDDWRLELKHLRMDVAATLNLAELAWNLLLPAGIAVTAILLVARLWVQPWLYPVIGAAGLLVGMANYWRVHWQRSRRLRTLRAEPGGEGWADAAAIVKRVATPETTMHYGAFAGRRYAHPEREVFAEELAKRMLEEVNGVPVSPSILEKYRDQLAQLYPDLYAYRDDEEERIMQLLIETVEGAETGLVPKAKLIEDVIEHGTGGGPVGKRRRRHATGYDPELVREAYSEHVPATFVEQEVTIPSRREDDDSVATVTGVSLRTNAVPPEQTEVQAQFAQQFSNYAEWDPRYVLPDVDEQLDAPPIYRGGPAEPPSTEVSHV